MALRSSLEIVTRSDVGRVRTHNEDAVYADPVLGLAILADGMGGYKAGEVASAMVTTLLSAGLEKSLEPGSAALSTGERRLLAQAVLAAEIAHANSAVYAAAQEQPAYAGMGTTLVMALFHAESITSAHIGDSRLYRLRGSEFRLITRDHSVLQEQIDRGTLTLEQARHSQHKNLLTRALGVDPTVVPEINEHDTRPGDLYLFCSDGLSDLVEDEDIAAILRRSPADLETAATQLVARANECGGHDNVSLILVRVRKCYPTVRGWLARLFAGFK